MVYSSFELTGRSRAHVIQLTQPRFAAQPEVAAAFIEMCNVASHEGIQIRPVSSFRDFDTQVSIWNKKFTGKKPLYDIKGEEVSQLDRNEQQIIDLILNWSAIPGGSRHHWGTEIDVFDASTVPSDYRPKLLPFEVAEDGPFSRLHRWLDSNMCNFGFFRPYNFFKGGMFPEPWHLSFEPISSKMMASIDLKMIQDAISEADLVGKDLLLKRLPGVFEKHVLNICAPSEQVPVSSSASLPAPRALQS